MDRQVTTCPNCRHRAEVVRDSTTGTVAFHCPTCYYLPNMQPAYTLSVSQYCGACDYRLTVRLPRVKHRVAFLRLRCPACHHANRVVPHYERLADDRIYPGPTDAYFGYPLWLQLDFGAHVLWAYNYEHLAHLKAYIGAGLRERQTLAFSTMVERLPPFIKAAKNREALLALLEKLARKDRPTP